MKNDFKVRYYNDGRTTVCLIKEDGTVVARGISICSKIDLLSGKGRELARNRALEARGRKADCGLIKLDEPRKGWFDIVDLSLAKDRFGDYKAYYMPVLTPTEVLFLSLKNRRPQTQENTVEDEVERFFKSIYRTRPKQSGNLSPRYS